MSWLKKYVESLRVPSVLPLVVRTSFRFNGRFHNHRFVTPSTFGLPSGQLKILNLPSKFITFSSWGGAHTICSTAPGKTEQWFSLHRALGFGNKIVHSLVDVWAKDFIY